MTYIEGQPSWGRGLAGVIIRALSCIAPDDRVWTITDGRIPCGRGWTHNGTEFIVLQNVQGQSVTDNGHNPAVQAKSMIERGDRILEKQGSSYRDVVRIWFYLSNILDWYGDFNNVRSDKYCEFGLMPKADDDSLLLPASTRVNGDNTMGTAGTMDLVAVSSRPGSKPFIKQLTNPTQKDAFCYGASFSRGTLIRQQDFSLIEVSGTAAIDKNGMSLYPGDVRSQIVCTLDKIEALI